MGISSSNSELILSMGPASLILSSTLPMTVGGTSILPSIIYNDSMPRRTISEKNEQEQNDNSQPLSGELIAEYANLSSSGGQDSFQGELIDRRRRKGMEEDSDEELQSLSQHSRSNLSVQARPNVGVSDVDSRTGKDRHHKADLISTGNRLNDISRLDDYQSRRENNKVNINSFLNSYGEMSSCMEDRLRVFSRDNKPKKPKPFVLPSEPQQKRIELITIPQADPQVAQLQYLSYLNRHHKIKGRDEYFQNLIRYSKHLQRYEDVNSSSFEEAKYKFYDRFMPQDLKISKNPYKMFQYNQKNKQWRNMLDRLG